MASKLGVGLKPGTDECNAFCDSYSAGSENSADGVPGQGFIRIGVAKENTAPSGALQHGTIIAIRPELVISRGNHPRGPAVIDVAFPAVESRYEVDLSGIDEGAADLLFGLVRGFRPTVALETGTHRGRSTKAIAAAMAKTGQGHLWTVDAVDYDLFGSGALDANEASRVTQILGMTPEVFKSEPLESLYGIDFAFLDGAHTKAGLEADLEYVYARCADECVIVVDNARDKGWPELEDMFKTYIKHPHINIDTLCGMEIIVVRKSESL